jgi:hypothetical protein
MEETGSQPIPPQLNGYIGELATPTDTGSIHKAYPEPHHWCRVKILPPGTKSTLT